MTRVSRPDLGNAPQPDLGKLFHVGWVVRDCAAAQRELAARLGAGPFRDAADAVFDQALVHGKPVTFALRIAFGRLGGVLLELLEPLDGESPHAEFLAAHGEGLHHLAFLVPDLDATLAAVRRADPAANLLVDGTGPGNPVRWVYLDGGAGRGTVTELLERTPRAEALFGDVLALLQGGALPRGVTAGGGGALPRGRGVTAVEAAGSARPGA